MPPWNKYKSGPWAKYSSKKSIFPEVGVEAGGTGIGDIALSTLQGMGKDISAIPAHFLNQLLLNAPRSLASKFGYQYPEETTSLVAGALAKTAGVVGGLKNPLIRMMTGGGNIPQQILRSAAIGGLYSPTEDFGDLGQRSTQAAISGAIPAVGGAISRVARPLVREDIPKIVRGIASVTSKSVKWLKERGADKIFDSAKEQIDYVKSDLAPRLYKIYQSKTEGAMERAGQLYDVALNKIKSPQIGLSKTFKTIQDTLKNYDLVDKSGNLVANIKDREIPSSIKIMADMYSHVVGQPSGKAMISGIKVTPQVNKGYFSFYRQLLRQSQKTAGEFKSKVQNVIESLYDDMESAGASGIKAAKDLYRKGAKFESEHSYTMESLASKLQSAADNPKNWKLFRETLRPVFGNNTNEVFNLLKDYRVAQEMSAHSRVPIGFIGALSKGAKSGLQGYYEKVLPTVQAGQQIGGKGIDLIRNLIRKTQGL